MENYTIELKDPYGNIRYYNHRYQLHRLDGAAVEWGGREIGYKEWWVNGKRHRLDGPAIAWAIRKEWFIDGFEYTKSKHNRLVLFFTLEPRRIDLGPTEDD